MRKNSPILDKNVVLKIIDSGWEEIDKGLLHDKETKFNIHVEIKNNKRNALIGYFAVLTESGKEISCDSTRDMPIKSVLVPAGVALTKWIQAERDMLGKSIKGEQPIKLWFKSFDGEQIRLYAANIPS